MDITHPGPLAVCLHSQQIHLRHPTTLHHSLSHREQRDFHTPGCPLLTTAPSAVSPSTSSLSLLEDSAVIGSITGRINVPTGGRGQSGVMVWGQQHQRVSSFKYQGGTYFDIHNTTQQVQNALLWMANVCREWRGQLGGGHQDSTVPSTMDLPSESTGEHRFSSGWNEVWNSGAPDSKAFCIPLLSDTADRGLLCCHFSVKSHASHPMWKT